ncbi:MAG: NAD(P)-dependent glycerol-3-phosphate dehydrogenase [Candidatus Protistobacter heckmanni]|nr:NAD(P)-dependent glycerol-3-phosphate dehydrogenase [Candidatus Protistobacter heckmanni]
MKLSIFGAGAWGTAMAAHAARSHDALLWGREPALAAVIRGEHANPHYLAGVALPEALQATDDFAAAAAHAAGGLAVIATPLSGLAELCVRLLDAGGAKPAGIVWLCKGIEPETGFLPHQIAARELQSAIPSGALSGPSFAREVALSLPCALVAASADEGLRKAMQQAFHHHAMRVYASDDLVGVEIGGAVKNVLAIATGIGDGLGLGFNARAALVTRGLAEMARLGLALGGRAETLQGLAGMGDLLLTATGDLSRNRTVGLKLAEGEPLEKILAELGHVAEGVRCAAAVKALAQRHGIEMPITSAVCGVLAGECAASDAVALLLKRDPRSE